IRQLSIRKPEAALAIGKLFEEEGDLEQALRHYRQLETLQGKNQAYDLRIAHVYHRLAIRENDRGNYIQATNYINQAIRTHADLSGLKQTQAILKDNQANRRYIPEL